MSSKNIWKYSLHPILKYYPLMFYQLQSPVRMFVEESESSEVLELRISVLLLHLLLSSHHYPSTDPTKTDVRMVTNNWNFPVISVIL